MATITLNAAHQAVGRFDVALAALRKILDAHVSHRMRLATVEAEQVCSTSS